MKLTGLYLDAPSPVIFAMPHSPPLSPLVTIESSSSDLSVSSAPMLLVDQHLDESKDDDEGWNIVKKRRQSLTLQDFHVLRTLGTGSFGRVHLVRSKHNDKHYALKVLKKQQVVQLKQVEHTRSERETLMNVVHPFIINLWGTFQDDANLYLVMDYVPGGELFSLMRKFKVKHAATDLCSFDPIVATNSKNKSGTDIAAGSCTFLRC